jgi:Sec-independent protein translocase protein TatA
MPFNVGFTELIVVLAIALIMLGPKWLLGPASRSAVGSATSGARSHTSRPKPLPSSGRP